MRGNKLIPDPSDLPIGKDGFYPVARGDEQFTVLDRNQEDHTGVHLLFAYSMFLAEFDCIVSRRHSFRRVNHHNRNL